MQRRTSDSDAVKRGVPLRRRRHAPRKRGIQYTATSGFHHGRSGIPDHPLGPVIGARRRRDPVANDDGRKCRTAAPLPARTKASAGLKPGLDRAGVWIPGKSSAGRDWRGTGNEGVGEHVRTRFHLRLASRLGLEAGEIADRKDPHRTKKTCFFCRTDFRSERTLFENAIQPFDLMSRRHPLSSTGPSD
jgi:hypothetical protein